MPVELIPVFIVEAAYGVAVIFYGARPGAPVWLSAPHTLWDRMLHGPRTPAPAPRPDYDRIRFLERHLGMAADDRPMRREKVCLVKGCQEDDVLEFRSWDGMLLARVHEH